MKICLIVIGQSTEGGNCRLSDYTTSCPARIASRGAPVESPVSGHYYDMVARHLYDLRGWWVSVRNIAVDGTSIVTNWCGDSGDGSPLSMSQEGFDPNAYLAAAVAEIDACPNYDEYWSHISFGQQDTNEGTSSGDYAQGHLNAAEYLSSIGITKNFLGLSIHSENDVSDHYQTTLTPGIQTALSAGLPYIYRGANLRNALGRAETVPLYDGVHPSLAAQSQAARAVANQIAKLQQT